MTPLRWYWIVLAAGVGLTALLVGLIRAYALRQEMIDHPGPRGSHTRPTPRGGGVAIVLVLLLTGGIQSWLTRDWPLAIGLAGMSLVAVVGWIDDRRSLGVRPRLAAHVIGALLLLPLALTLPQGGSWVMVGAMLWWVFWGVSAVNVVNFMDGIDGLIGSQIVLVGVHFALLRPGGNEALAWSAALVGSGLGFLLWNWAPAKIFLGDSGSGALGLALVVGGMLAMRDGHSLVESYLPLFPLFADATSTLLLRLQRGERVTVAHRSHLYQRLANGSMGHAKVSLLYAAAALGGVLVAQVPPPRFGAAGTGYILAVLLLGFWMSARAGRTGSAGR